MRPRFLKRLADILGELIFFLLEVDGFGRNPILIDGRKTPSVSAGSDVYRDAAAVEAEGAKGYEGD